MTANCEITSQLAILVIISFLYQMKIAEQQSFSTLVQIIFSGKEIYDLAFRIICIF